MIVKIKGKLSIEPKYLDKDLDIHLLNKLKKTIIGTCSYEYGYIININKIIKIFDNFIAPANSLIVFNIIYEAEVLKPKIGQYLKGTVCMVFQNGIFVNINDKMKVLVPSSFMKSYTFCKNYFINNENNSKISINDEVTVKITRIKYEKKEFGCIGELKL
jgi:DNA-directed RNA polymerase subunit E'/Rpb7